MIIMPRLHSDSEELAMKREQWVLTRITESEEGGICATELHQLSMHPTKGAPTWLTASRTSEQHRKIPKKELYRIINKFLASEQIVRITNGTKVYFIVPDQIRNISQYTVLMVRDGNPREYKFDLTARRVKFGTRARRVGMPGIAPGDLTLIGGVGGNH